MCISSNAHGPCFGVPGLAAHECDTCQLSLSIRLVPIATEEAGGGYHGSMGLWYVDNCTSLHMHMLNLHSSGGLVV